MHLPVKLIMAFILLIFIAGCGPGNPATPEVAEGEPTMTDSLSSKREPTEMARFFKDNISAYPRDIRFFEHKEVQRRIKTMVGNEYDSILKKFNVESPIVNDGDVYKTTGCEKHNCPGYHTLIFYDAGSDNFNVVIERNGEVMTWQEDGIILVSDRLKSL